METKSGLDLLSRYALRRDEDAFGALVFRHLNPVYSVALRRLAGDSSLAVEVTQSVFADLARKALESPMDMNRFKPLGGWLHRHACFLSAKAVRGEVRRKAREAVAAALPVSNPEEVWTVMAPWVDEAVETLPEGSREALILRFYEQLDFRAIGVELGITDDTAQKRVSRALERLRDLLEARGVTSTASALGVALGGHAVTAAPAGIGVLIASAVRAALVPSVPASPFTWLVVKSAKAQLAGAAILAVADAAASNTALAAAAARQEAERAELLQLRGALAGMQRTAVPGNTRPSQGPTAATSANWDSTPSDAEAIVTRVSVDAESQRQSEPVRIPAKRIAVTKLPAELGDAGTQSTVAAAESVPWATLHDAGAFSVLVADQSSMVGPGDKFGETEKVRASFLKNLTNCTEVRFILQTQEATPIPGETVSLALTQADCDQPVMLSLKFVPAGDGWLLEQMGLGNGR